MPVTIRRVYRRGNSLTFTLPGKWAVPEVLYVYVNENYLVYSQVRGLENEFRVKYVGKIKRRSVRYWSKGGVYREYYLITIPRGVCHMLGMREGMEVLVIEITEYEAKTYLVFTSLRAFEDYGKKLVAH